MEKRSRTRVRTRERERERDRERERERMRENSSETIVRALREGLIDLQGLIGICARKTWKALLLLSRNCRGGCACLVAKRKILLWEKHFFY